MSEELLVCLLRSMLAVLQRNVRLLLQLGYNQQFQPEPNPCQLLRLRFEAKFFHTLASGQQAVAHLDLEV